MQLKFSFWEKISAIEMLQSSSKKVPGRNDQEINEW